MTIAPSLAATAYEVARARAAGGPAEIAGAGLAGGEGSSFGALLKGVVNDAVATGGAAEQASMNAVAGEGSLVDAVSAIAAAEVTLQTVVAVRDRVVGAYQEIMRMPI
ncbi:MAG: flagellar hook-basal body complex protein FliE [Alphaproteobacteria bacterium]|nr:flagellar hook-basal body complex protein FliE [Alphaproteobacteria bacterium]